MKLIDDEKILQQHKRVRDLVFSVRMTWDFAKQLFESGDENIELMKWSASTAFFGFIQFALFESVVSGVCRLTDPATSGNPDNPNENLSLQRLTNYIYEADNRAGKWARRQYHNEVQKFEPLRTMRNNVISHTDLEHQQLPCTLEEMDSATEALVRVIESIDRCFNEGVVAQNSRFRFKLSDISHGTDGTALLELLREHKQSLDRRMEGRKKYYSTEEPSVPQIVLDELFKRNLSSTGSLVEKLVHELYGLTEEEIRNADWGVRRSSQEV